MAEIILKVLPGEEITVQEEEAYKKAYTEGLPEKITTEEQYQFKKLSRLYLAKTNLSNAILKAQNRLIELENFRNSPEYTESLERSHRDLVQFATRDITFHRSKIEEIGLARFRPVIKPPVVPFPYKVLEVEEIELKRRDWQPPRLTEEEVQSLMSQVVEERVPAYEREYAIRRKPEGEYVVSRWFEPSDIFFKSIQEREEAGLTPKQLEELGETERLLYSKTYEEPVPYSEILEERRKEWQDKKLILHPTNPLTAASDCMKRVSVGIRLIAVPQVFYSAFSYNRWNASTENQFYRSIKKLRGLVSDIRSMIAAGQLPPGMDKALWEYDRKVEFVKLLGAHRYYIRKVKKGEKLSDVVEPKAYSVRTDSDKEKEEEVIGHLKRDEASVILHGIVHSCACKHPPGEVIDAKEQCSPDGILGQHIKLIDSFAKFNMQCARGDNREEFDRSKYELTKVAKGAYESISLGVEDRGRISSKTYSALDKFQKDLSFDVCSDNVRKLAQAEKRKKQDWEKLQSKTFSPIFKVSVNSGDIRREVEAREEGQRNTVETKERYERRIEELESLKEEGITLDAEQELTIQGYRAQLPILEKAIPVRQTEIDEIKKVHKKELAEAERVKKEIEDLDMMLKVKTDKIVKAFSQWYDTFAQELMVDYARCQCPRNESWS